MVTGLMYRQMQTLTENLSIETIKTENLILTGNLKMRRIAKKDKIKTIRTIKIATTQIETIKIAPVVGGKIKGRTLLLSVRR